MSTRVLMYIYRKPGISPADFKTHYEAVHIPLVQSITGSKFPLSHTRRYITRREDATATGTTERNATYPASTLSGPQSDFDFDAISEMIFEDIGALQAFFTAMGQPDVAARLAVDVEMFMDQKRTSAVILGEYVETARKSSE